MIEYGTERKEDEIKRMESETRERQGFTNDKELLETNIYFPFDTSVNVNKSLRKMENVKYPQ